MHPLHPVLTWLILCSSKYFAVPWRGGGGPFVVWPLSKPGKLRDKPNDAPVILTYLVMLSGRLPQDVPLCTGHNGAVMDLHFSPFCDELVASGSDDTTTRIWKIPVGGQRCPGTCGV
eukprot:3920705-Rhodomonas_salina.2